MRRWCGSRPRSRSARCCCSRWRRPRRRRRPISRPRCGIPAPRAAAFGGIGCAARLVAAQVALSIALLVGAGLCIRSLSAARMTPGFEADGVVVGWLDSFSAGYTPDEGPRLLRASPRSRPRDAGRRIGVAQPAHPAWLHRRQLLRRHGRGPRRRDDDPQGVGLNYVGPDYAATLKIPLVAGRDCRRGRSCRSAARRGRQRSDGADLLEGPRSDRRPLHVRRPAAGPGTAVDHRGRRRQGHQAAHADRAAAAQRRSFRFCSSIRRRRC